MSQLFSLISNVWSSSSSTQPPPAQVPEPAAGENAEAQEQQQHDENNNNNNNAENVQEPAPEAAKPPSGEDESDMWEETFKSHTDSKPYGNNKYLYLNQLNF